MHDRAIRSRPGDRRERYILERPGLAAEGFKCFHCVDFGEFAGRCFPVEPGEKLHDRRAIALVGGTAADDLGVILRRLQQCYRIGTALRLAAGAGKHAGECICRARLIKAYGFFSELAEIADEVIRRAYVGEFLQGVVHIVGKLGGADIKRRPAFGGDQCKGKHQGRMCDVCPADVERPGDILGIGDQKCIGAEFL